MSMCKKRAFSAGLRVSGRELAFFSAALRPSCGMHCGVARAREGLLQRGEHDNRERERSRREERAPKSRTTRT